MFDGMRNAREALAEYYREDAPVIVLLDAAIVEAEGSKRAYELLLNENAQLRARLEAFKCVGVIDANGDIYPGGVAPGTKIFTTEHAHE